MYPILFKYCTLFFSAYTINSFPIIKLYIDFTQILKSPENPKVGKCYHQEKEYNYPQPILMKPFSWLMCFKSINKS